MATLLADPPPASSLEQPPAPGPPAGAPAPTAPSTSSHQPACANCRSPMAAGQHWCLVCGAGRRGSLASAPKRRSAALVLGATTILVAGAAATAYAAWGEPSTGRRHVVEIVQLTPPAPAPTPTPPTAVGPPTTIKPTPSPPAAKPPTVPRTTATPKTPAAANTTPTGQPTATPPKTTTGGSTEAQRTPVSLDTNAASTYNPYAYPATRFGDPTLAIDGDPSTSWNAQVDPVGAPKMAEGLAIDLKTPRKLSALLLITSTPGMRIQVYGAKGAAPPTTITDPAWIQLSSSQLVKNRHTRLKLRDSTKAFRFVTVWISKAPPGSTPQSPGHASVNELELFSA